LSSGILSTIWYNKILIALFQPDVNNFSTRRTDNGAYPVKAYEMSIGFSRLVFSMISLSSYNNLINVTSAS